MAKWIRVLGLPVVEIKPWLPAGFTDTELLMLIGTDIPALMFPGDDGTVLLYDDESTDAINERACELLEIPTAKALCERLLAHGT